MYSFRNKLKWNIFLKYSLILLATLNYRHCSHFAQIVYLMHDDVIKWKHFPRYWPFVRGIHQSPVNSPNKGKWRGALMFSMIYAWINGWVNNREVGDLWHHRVHYDITVMAFYHDSFVYMHHHIAVWIVICFYPHMIIPILKQCFGKLRGALYHRVAYLRGRFLLILKRKIKIFCWTHLSYSFSCINYFVFWLWVHSRSLRFNYEYTVETLYNTINFCSSTHKRHSIARPKGRGMGCLLWVQRATYCVDLSKLSSIKYLL